MTCPFFHLPVLVMLSFGPHRLHTNICTIQLSCTGIIPLLMHGGLCTCKPGDGAMKFNTIGHFCFPECRDVLLPLLVDQLSGQLDDNSSKPDHEACSQLLSNILEVLDRKEVVS